MTSVVRVVGVRISAEQIDPLLRHFGMVGDGTIPGTPYQIMTFRDNIHQQCYFIALSAARIAVGYPSPKKVYVPNHYDVEGLTQFLNGLGLALPIDEYLAVDVPD